MSCRSQGKYDGLLAQQSAFVEVHCCLVELVRMLLSTVLAPETKYKH